MAIKRAIWPDALTGGHGHKRIIIPRFDIDLLPNFDLTYPIAGFAGRKLINTGEKLEGDAGAKVVMEDTQYELRTVACRAAQFDVDNKDDLVRLGKY